MPKIQRRRKMKKKLRERDVDECYLKIREILKEYNCHITTDDDLGGSIVIVDKDNLDYEIID